MSAASLDHLGRREVRRPVPPLLTRPVAVVDHAHYALSRVLLSVIPTEVEGSLQPCRRCRSLLARPGGCPAPTIPLSCTGVAVCTVCAVFSELPATAGFPTPDEVVPGCGFVAVAAMWRRFLLRMLPARAVPCRMTEALPGGVAASRADTSAGQPHRAAPTNPCHAQSLPRVVGEETELWGEMQHYSRIDKRCLMTFITARNSWPMTVQIPTR